MPRDPRPYLTYPIGYTIHPRLDMLTDPAFRAFHEMNDYCRMNKTDGRIAKPLAAKRWTPKVLRELVAGDGDRPLVILDGDTYFLRSYAEHQFTNDDAEELRQRRVEAGRKGGLAKAENLAKRKQAASGEVSKPLANASENGWQNVAESESKSELQTDVTYVTESSQVGDGPDSDSDRVSVHTIRARNLGVDDLASVRGMLATVVGEPVSMRGALEMCQAILSKSPRPVSKGDAYVATACRTTPDEVRQAYWDLDIGAVA